jgi:Domain of unknown function (DUF4386)
MESNQKKARISGLLFLLTALTSAFHFLYVRPKIFLPKNATETINNLILHESLFRMGIMSIIISQIFFLFLGFALYRLFVDVNKIRARIQLTFIAIIVTLTLFNTLFNFAALIVLSKVDYLATFEQAQLSGLSMMFLKLNNYGQGIVEIFWGLWFFAFGLLIIESKYAPRVIGILMITACLSYLINILFGLFIPYYHSHYLTKAAMILGALATFPTILWLTIKGIKEHPLTTKSL